MEQRIPATGDTIAMWASSSKVVTGVAALKAMQTERIGLDTAINAYLPLKS